MAIITILVATINAMIIVVAFFVTTYILNARSTVAPTHTRQGTKYEDSARLVSPNCSAVE